MIWSLMLAAWEALVVKLEGSTIWHFAYICTAYALIWLNKYLALLVNGPSMRTISKEGKSRLPKRLLYGQHRNHARSCEATYILRAPLRS